MGSLFDSQETLNNFAVFDIGDKFLETDKSGKVIEEPDTFENLFKSHALQQNINPKETSEIENIVADFKALRVEKTWMDEEEEIVGNQKIQNQILEAFLTSNLDGKLQYRAMLLAGLPGTGKTCNMLSAAIRVSAVTRKTVSVFVVRPGDLLSRYQGESEKRAHILYKVAAEFSPSLVIIDEADGVMRARSDNESDCSRTFKNTLMSELQGVADHSGVFTICSTNRPWEIDTAFIRRFSGIYCIYPPTTEQRISIFKKFLKILEKTTTVLYEEINFERLAAKTDGYTGDDLRKLVASAAYAQTRIEHNGSLYEVGEIKNIIGDLKSDSKPPKTVILPVGNNQLFSALLKIGPTNTTSNFRDLKKWERKNIRDEATKDDTLSMEHSDESDIDESDSEDLGFASCIGISASCNMC